MPRRCAAGSRPTPRICPRLTRRARARRCLAPSPTRRRANTAVSLLRGAESGGPPAGTPLGRLTDVCRRMGCVRAGSVDARRSIRMSKAYRIGIIGLGHMGKRYFEVLEQSPRWELAWACDRDPGNLAWAAQQSQGVRTTPDA